MRKPFVAGNWKMNTSLAEAIKLAQAVAEKTAGLTAKVEVGVCPPFVWLTAVKAAVSTSQVGVGAQNASPEKNGAFTGQVSLGMLGEIGCKYVIIGHSETRHTIDRGESDAFLNAKVKAALAAGLIPIFCIGEKLEQRDANQTNAVNQQQLAAGLAGLTADQVAKIVIAYEPVWAIGTGRTATPQQAQEAHAFIRSWLKSTYGPAVAESVRIQYGGSMNAKNAKELLGQPDVDGGLIGGAALKPDDFVTIIQAAADVKG